MSTVVRSNFFAINLFNRKNYLFNKDGLIAAYYYPNGTKSMQTFSIFMKQLKIATIKESATLSHLVEKAKDSSYEILDEFGMTDNMNVGEIANCEIIMKNTKSAEGYSFINESMFGELIVNAENPYAIKHLQRAKEGLASHYQQALFEAVKKEDLDRDLLKKIDLGFDFDRLPD